MFWNKLLLKLSHQNNLKLMPHDHINQILPPNFTWLLLKTSTSTVNKEHTNLTKTQQTKTTIKIIHTPRERHKTPGTSRPRIKRLKYVQVKVKNHHKGGDRKSPNCPTRSTAVPGLRSQFPGKSRHRHKWVTRMRIWNGPRTYFTLVTIPSKPFSSLGFD